MADAERALPVYLQNLKASESLGEEVIADQQEIVDLDRKRNTNREALRALKTQDDKVWVLMGNEFVKVDKVVAEGWLQNDQSVLDKEIDSLRDGLKDKVAAIKRMEGSELSSGFNLKPMGRGELGAVYEH
eukprot:sb/3475145/